MGGTCSTQVSAAPLTEAAREPAREFQAEEDELVKVTVGAKSKLRDTCARAVRLRLAAAEVLLISLNGT